MKIAYSFDMEIKDKADNESNTEKSKGYRSEIDGLRAIAVIAVIINHFNQDLLPGGFLGVDIFFVISGYVITKSLQRHKESNLKQLLAGFYERRIKRLFPALAICLFITSIAIVIVNPQPLQSLRTGLMATVGASNFYLIKNSTNYFAQSSELNPFLHTWSLAVEEQFYLIYPILFWICNRRPSSKKSLGYLPVILWILSSLSLVGAIVVQGKNPETAYFSMPFRFWEMAAGCLLCSNLFTRFTAKAGSGLFQFLCCISVFSLFILFSIPKAYIIPSTITTVVFTGLFILAGESKNFLNKLLSHKWSTYIGTLSYSLYLWHWPILSIGRWTVGVNAQTVLPLIIIIVLASAASYHCIEQPFRHYSWGKSHITSITKGVAMIAATSAGIVGISNNHYYIYKITNNLSASQGSLNLPIHWKDQESQYAEIIEKCHIDQNSELNKSRIKECLGTNSEKAVHRGFFIGDSHAVNHYFGAEEGLPQFALGLYTSGWGCGYIPDKAALEVKKIDCLKYNSLVNEYLLHNASEGDIVFVGMRWVHKKLYADQIEQRLNDLAGKLEGKGVKIILLDDVAELPDTSLCTPRWYRNNSNTNPLCQKSITKLDEELSGLTLLGRKLENTNKNVSFLRLRDAVCVRGQCSVFENGEALYIDEGHLTSASSKRNAKVFSNHIRSLYKQSN